MKFITFFILLSISTAAFSEESTFDRFNSYQWNKKNHFRKNNKTDKKPWYEWWYYKVVLPNPNDSFYAVYGVVNPWDKDKTMKGTRAYVGFGNFKEKILAGDEFGVEDFSASYEATEIRVGERNFATDKHFEGVAYDELRRPQFWNVDVDEKKWAFNAMGWGMGIPNFINIYWYPAQADATCSGKILSFDKFYEFTGAPCYQDRNWGSSFPEWWSWIVSNKFNEDETAALAVGGGLPELFGKKIYSGVTVGLKYKGREYSFRPNDLDLIKTNIKWGKWNVTAQSQDLRIEIVATAPNDSFMDLRFVTPEGDIFHDYETLTGDLTVKIYEPTSEDNKERWKHIDTLTSSYAGIEYGSKNEQKLMMEMLAE